MRQTIVTCDRCKGVIADKEQVWGIQLDWQCYPRQPEINRYSVPKAEWCRACMEDLGLLGEKYKVTPNNPTPTPPSLEDLIRDIVREEILNQ